MLGWIYRLSRQRGPTGGSRVWTLVWGLALAVRVLRWLGRERVRVVQEVLEPGETLLVRHLPAGTSSDGR